MAGTAFSQISMPSVSMPEISTPTMPSILMPSVSSGNNENTDEASKQKNSSSSSNNTVGTGLTATALMGLSNTTGLETLSALLGASDETSTDSSSLSSLSSLSSISSLLSSDSTLSSLSSLQGTSSNANYLLLSQIIEKLNDISKKLDNSQNTSSGNSQKTDETTQGSAQTTQSAVAATANETRREIVRFRINSSNILSSITDVYISKPETNGSFLLTADRVYTADYKKRTETFYMFFTPENNKMTVTISVLQDYENKNSFLYRLSALSPIETKKTGNLISIMINNPSFKVDFLLSLE